MHKDATVCRFRCHYKKDQLQLGGLKLQLQNIAIISLLKLNYTNCNNQFDNKIPILLSLVFLA